MILLVKVPLRQCNFQIWADFGSLGINSAGIPIHNRRNVNLQAQKWNIQQISSVFKKSEEIRADDRDETRQEQKTYFWTESAELEPPAF